MLYLSNFICIIIKRTLVYVLYDNKESFSFNHCGDTYGVMMKLSHMHYALHNLAYASKTYVTCHT